MRIQQQAIAMFEKQLDIRSLASTRVDLSILLNLLLTREQILLFRNQRARTYTKASSSADRSLSRDSRDSEEDREEEDELSFA